MFPKHAVCVFVKGTMGTYLPFHVGAFVSRFQPHIPNAWCRRYTRGLDQVREANDEGSD